MKAITQFLLSFYVERIIIKSFLPSPFSTGLNVETMSAYRLSKVGQRRTNPLSGEYRV